VTFFAFKQREKEFIAQGRTLQARCSASNTSFARQSMPTTRHRMEHAWSARCSRSCSHQITTRNQRPKAAEEAAAAT